MQPRRSLPALALVMPHPDLPTRNDPRTPRPNTPSTPILFPKQLMASPRTSMESWGSSSGHPEEDVLWEWKSEQISLLTRTLEALPGHLYTPFNGAVPPSNLLDKIAKSVAYAQGPLEWPHSVRQTRAKLVEIARGRNKENMSMTIDEADEEEGLPAKRPLYRQSSMDFLPTVKEKNSVALTRLSARLQRIDRLIPIYHPYPRPSSRSPSPPATDHFKDAYPFPPIALTTPTRSSTRTRPSLPSFPPSHPHPPLRRSLSTLSNPLSDVSMASSASGGASKPMPMKRSDSFTAAPPRPPPGMKRAPSYGSVSVVSAASSGGRMDVDGEEGVMVTCDAVSVKGKRPRRSSATSSRGGSISPERKKKKSGSEEKSATAAVASTTKVKVKVKAKGKSTATATAATAATSMTTRTRSTSSAMKPTLSSAAKQAGVSLPSPSPPTSNANPNCAISTRTPVARSPKTSSSTSSSPKSSSINNNNNSNTTRARSSCLRAKELSSLQPHTAPIAPSPTNTTMTHSPTPTPARTPTPTPIPSSGSKSAPSTLAYRSKPPRGRITRSNSMFGAELPMPQAPVVLPTSPSKVKVGLPGGEEGAGREGAGREAERKEESGRTWNSNPLPGVRPPLPFEMMMRRKGEEEEEEEVPKKKEGEKTLRRVRTMAFPQGGWLFGNNGSGSGAGLSSGSGSNARDRRGSVSVGRRRGGLVASVEEEVRKLESESGAGGMSSLGSAFEMK